MSRLTGEYGGDSCKTLILLVGVSFSKLFTQRWDESCLLQLQEWHPFNIFHKGATCPNAGPVWGHEEKG